MITSVLTIIQKLHGVKKNFFLFEKKPLDKFLRLRYHTITENAKRKKEVTPMVRNNIEAERGRLGLTKSALCTKLGITTKTYNGYLAGQSIPSRVLEALRNLTGKSVDYLLGLTDN